MPRSLFTRLFLLVSISFNGFHGFAQKVPSVSGYVKTASGEALPGVTVSILKTAHGVTTDGNGFFALPAMKTGTYTVQATLMGYKAVSETVTVQAGKTASFNFQLLENQQNLNEVSIYGKTETQAV